MKKITEFIFDRLESNKIFKCEHCEREFPSHTSLGGHMGKMHSKNPKVKKISKTIRGKG